jgi:heme exporter protein CcmD
MNHDFYIAMSYGALAVAILAELAILRWRRAQALKQVETERDLETQD